MVSNELIIRLAEQAESFYLYDEEKMKEQIHRLAAAFPGVDFLYSVKCNPNKEILHSVFSEGLGADAASLGEVLLAHNAGLHEDRIFYSAPGKATCEIEKALGISTIIADSLSEVERISSLVGTQQTKIGLRINPDFSFYGGAGAASKFGVDEAEALNYLRGQAPENIRVTGIHVHLKSQELNGCRILPSGKRAGGDYMSANNELNSFSRKTLTGGRTPLNYQEINAQTIDRWIEEGWEWGKPISHETYVAAQNGIWDVLLTPTKPMPHAWLGELKGKKLFGLASGGGQQMPIFTALGAECTVLDYSESQIASEILVAERENYKIHTIRADMTKPLPFADESFDIIFHPISNCYIEKVEPVFKECFRILKKGGVLVCGLDNGVNFLVNDDETQILNHMPFNPLKDAEQMRQLEESDCGVQFSHTLEEQIGGQLKAGFILTNIYDDINGGGRLHELNINSFIATRAIKPE